MNNVSYGAVYRISVPASAGLSKITEIRGDSKTEKNGIINTANNMKEQESLEVLEPGQVLGLSYYWEQPINADIKDYQLKIFKESGLNNVDYSIKLEKTDRKFQPPQGFALTEGGKLVYNTKLLTDLVINLKAE
jgi:hypothetical protein